MGGGLNRRRNRWRESIWQKVKDCEAAKPLVQRIALGVTENWSYLRTLVSHRLVASPHRLPSSGCGALHNTIRWARARCCASQQLPQPLCKLLPGASRLASIR
jgi:hypothetical protein